jgi:phage terminase large subunit-like protein
LTLEGNIIDRDWVHTYIKLPDDLCDFIQSWDLTFKKTGTSLVCGMVWARRASNNAKYLVDMVHKKMGYVEMKEALRDLSQR